MKGVITITRIFASFLLYVEQLRNLVAAKKLWIIPCIMFVCHLSNTAAWAQKEINSGKCSDGTISSPGSVDTFKFYGDAGDSVVIVATTVGGYLDPEVFLYAPDGTKEATTWAYTQARIDDHQLAMTGWYRIVVEDRDGDKTGNFKLCLLKIPGATSKGQISSGQCIAGTVSHTIESFEFYGDAGDSVVIVATTVSGYLDPEVFLYAPDGTKEATTWAYTQARIDDHQLVETGWYRIVVEDRDGKTGNFKLCLLKIPGATSKGQISSGQCIAGTVSHTIESFEFYGDAGDSVVIVATTVSGYLDPEVFLYAPDGTKAATTWAYTQARIDDHQLVETGWYRIVVEDRDGKTGNFKLCLLKIPGATSKGQISSGQCIAGTVSHTIESFEFYGDAGDSVVIVATTVSGYLDPEVFLYAPDGTKAATTWAYTQARIDDHQLVETGWYRIVVEDRDGKTGEFSLCLTKIPPSYISLLYTPVKPCRIADTRKAGGAISAGGIRSYNVWGAVTSQGGNPAGCPSPKGEPLAVHVNVTSVPLGNGWITAYPFGSAAPLASLVNYRSDAQNVANSGTIKTRVYDAKDINIKSGGGKTHVIIDVLGYYYYSKP